MVVDCLHQMRRLRTGLRYRLELRGSRLLILGWFVGHRILETYLFVHSYSRLEIRSCIRMRWVARLPLC